jgi:hypothetical protein
METEKLVQIFHQREPDYRLTTQGKTMPVTDMVKVASFKTDLPTEKALDEAFRLTNDHDDGMWESNPALTMEPGEHSSTSIGDVVVVQGEAFQCVKGGWTKRQDFTPSHTLNEHTRDPTPAEFFKKDTPTTFFKKALPMQVQPPNLANVKLIDPPGSSVATPSTPEAEPAKELNSSPYFFAIDEAKTIRKNRHEAAGQIHKYGSKDRFDVDLEWNENYREGFAKSTLLKLQVSDSHGETIIDYDGVWKVRPATDEAQEILTLAEDRYGPVAQHNRQYLDLSNAEQVTTTKANTKQPDEENFTEKLAYENKRAVEDHFDKIISALQNRHEEELNNLREKQDKEIDKYIKAFHVAESRLHKAIDPDTTRMALQWEHDNRNALDRHFESSRADINARHMQERQQINATTDPIDNELLEEKHDRELSGHERAKENAELRHESMIDDMWRDGVVPEQNFTIPGRDHDLTHDPNSRDDDSGRGGRGR